MVSGFFAFYHIEYQWNYYRLTLFASTRYDPRFGEAFWNSSRFGMLHYLLNMMTSWAIVCDVWYLPAMTRAPGESAVDFANRVKAVIARRGGLVDLQWSVAHDFFHPFISFRTVT